MSGIKEIENYEFIDDEISLRKVVNGRIELYVGTTGYIEIHKKDAIALSKHFNLVRSDF